MSRSIDEILESSRTVAVVGASRDPEKPGSRIPRRLIARGFDIVPVTPAAPELFDRTAYRSLEAVPKPVDVVQVFRPPEEAPEIARQAVAIGARVLWLQEEITSEEARAIAEAGGLDFVQDRCMAIESDRLDIHKDG